MSHYGYLLFLTFLLFAIDTSFGQVTANIFGAGTPAVADGGDPRSIVLGVKIFSDVPGQVLGCSFYKAAANIGVHVVSLWDSVGRLLATQVVRSETASGRQLVLFSTPVSIAANQVFTCGYFAPNGHFSNDKNTFTSQSNVPPLHVPTYGGVFVYSEQSTRWPTSTWTASNYWVDVLFAPATQSPTWISGTSVITTRNTANITWDTAVPSDSQVEYGPTIAYGNITALAGALVTSHSVAIEGLLAGTIDHFRVRCRDSDAVMVIGLDHTMAMAPPVSVSMFPANAAILANATLQFKATVSNTLNPAVAWSATAGSVNSSGLFTAPTVSSPISGTVTATSQDDASKSASAVVMVNAANPVLTVNPTSLSFDGEAGATSPAPGHISVTSTETGSFTFTAVSDQPWLLLSATSGTTPSTLQVSPSATGLQPGSYAGQVTLKGGAETKVVTVALILRSPVQRSVALSWNGSTNSHVVSYSLYRSTVPGASYGLAASTISGVKYLDQSVQPGVTYYYVVTAVDDRGQESGYSNEIKAVVP
ncbi:MAG: DUF4082 domain-containing protein [Terriglobales bacterium]